MGVVMIGGWWLTISLSRQVAAVLEVAMEVANRKKRAVVMARATTMIFHARAIV
jgi:hypothetical protein